MLVENQNKSMGEKLQAFDQVPEGFDFSSDAVWQELETKLHQGKKQNGFATTKKYLVAASLLLAVSLIIILLITNHNSSANSELVAKKIPLPTMVQEKKPQEETMQPTKNVAHNNIPIKKKDIVIPEKETVHDLAITEPLPIKESQPITETPANSTIPSIAIIVEKQQPIVKKHLPIIHINELNRAPEPMYSKNNNKNIYLNEVEETPASNEHPKSWWQPKPKPVNPIISLTDNQ